MKNLTSNEEDWSWEKMSWSWITILQLNSAIVGVIGNAFVLLVIVNQKKNARNSTDILIGALALADFLSSIAIVPIPRATRVPSSWAGAIYCRLVHSAFFMWTFVSASIYSLTTIAIERFTAVVYPLRFRVIFSKRRTYVYVVIIWLLCLAVMIPHSHFYGNVSSVTNLCTFGSVAPSTRLAFGAGQVIFKFVVPFVIMIISQALTILTLHRQSKTFDNVPKELNNQLPKALIAKKKVIRMLILVIVIFCICWGPNQIAFMLFSVGVLGPWYIVSPLRRIFTVLGFYNSCANPIIYTISNPQFRVALLHSLSGRGLSNTAIFVPKTE